MAKDINIGGRLHSIATGNVVAGADEILDDNLGKKQTQINTETYSLVESVNNALDALNPDQQEALAVATKANANEAKLGYYVCDTDADVAAKTVVAVNYVLGTGGSIKVKMTNDNTVNKATLNINSTGAKPLFYEGVRASSTNSWTADDVLEIYYDGTKYQAKNVIPTFKTGEKIHNVGVDDEPTAGSENVVKSGGVYDEDNSLKADIWNKYHRSFGSPLYENSYFVIENGQVSIKSSDYWKVYMLKLEDLDCISTLSATQAPAFCYLTSNNISSYISNSEVFATESTTSPSIKAFVGKVPDVTSANYILINRRMGEHYMYGTGYTYNNDLENRLNEIEDDISDENDSILSLNKKLWKSFHTSDICVNKGYFTISNNAIVVTSSNNWTYGIISIDKIKLLEATSFVTSYYSFPVVAFLSGDSISDYIAGSEIYNNTSEKKYTVVFDDVEIPSNATHVIVNNLKSATSNLFYKLAVIRNYYILDSNGNGDFSTIEEALQLADKNSTIFVKNGEYSLLTSANTKVGFVKGIKWVGESREKTIFSYYSGKYTDAPIMRSGVFDNITFISGYKSGVSPSVAPEKTGYCVHVDFMEKEEDVFFGVRFNNCHFKGYWNTCIGCGMRKDFVLEVHDCFIENLINENPIMDDVEHPNARYRFACISSHSVANTEETELIGSGTVKLHNNRLLSSKPSVITLQDNVGNVDYPVIWEFVGNSCYSENNQYNCIFSSTANAFISQWDNTRKLLSPLSWGNNINILNCQVSA